MSLILTLFDELIVDPVCGMIRQYMNYTVHWESICTAILDLLNLQSCDCVTRFHIIYLYPTPLNVEAVIMMHFKFQ